MNLSTKLLLPIICLCAVAIGAFSLFLWRMQGEGTTSHYNQARAYQIDDLIGRIEFAQNQIGIEMLSYGFDKRKAHLDRLAYLANAREGFLTALRQIYSGENEYLLRFEKAKQIMDRIHDAFIKEVQKGDRSRIEHVFKTWSLEAAIANAHLMDLMSYTYLGVRHTSDTLNSEHSSLLRMLFIIFVIAAIFFVFILLFYTRGIVKPIARLTTVANGIASGNLERHLGETDRSDEIGLLSRAFNTMTDNLIRSNEELGRKTQEMEDFVYTVSHDLKSPLVTSIGFLGFLKEDVAAGHFEKVKDSVQRLERANRRMSGLIDDLLEVSRIGRITLDLEEINVSALLRDIRSEFRIQLEEKGIRFELDDKMPLIIADRHRIRQVFENLLTNAIKYGSITPEPKINAGSLKADGELRFFVRDNGPGIPKEYHQKIFMIFQRISDDNEGTGVGLAIVSKIMQIHNGRVWVESEPEKGATFWLAFPLDGKK